MRWAEDETLVMAKVEIGFRAIVSDKHFAVLIRRHRAGINIQVGIALLEGNAKAATFKQAAHRSRCHAFTEGRNHAARNEDILRAAVQGARIPPVESAYNQLWSQRAAAVNFINQENLKREIISSRIAGLCRGAIWIGELAPADGSVRSTYGNTAVCFSTT